MHQLGDEKTVKPCTLARFRAGRCSRKEMIKRAAESEMRQLKIEKELEATRLAEAAKREEER